MSELAAFASIKNCTGCAWMRGPRWATQAKAATRIMYGTASVSQKSWPPLRAVTSCIPNDFAVELRILTVK